MPIRKKDDRLGAKKRFDPRTGEETNKPGGVDPRTIYRPKPDVKPTEMRTGGLSPKQKAIASKAPPPDKIDGKDFAVLKAEKAKGRGMGLQDESIKPGKVQKAFLGKMIKGAGKSVGRLFGRKQSATATPGAATMSGSGKGMGKMLPQLLQKAIDDGIVKTASKGKIMKANKGKMTPLKKDPTTPVNPFEKRRKQLGGGKLKALGRVMGSRAALLGFVGAGAAAGLNMAGKKLKEFADKKKDKKMGGGMMKKYSKGGGADTGRMGEMKSQFAVASDRVRRTKRDGDRLTQRDIDFIRRRSRNRDEDRLTNRDIETASSAIKGYKSGGKTKKLKDDYFKVLGVFPTVKKKMGGGMMQRPMGYKSGTMVKARGCKLGRNKKTKLY
jgi:hypothetical protein